MVKTKNDVLALIPARGGSKSIPGKNIVPLDGRPMIEYVAKAAQKSSLVSKIICSTDSDAIAAVCSQLGIAVMKRPAELAQDDTHIIDVIISALRQLEIDGGLPFAVSLLQPTSPFLLPEHIDQCISLLRSHPNAGSVQTIASFSHNYHAYNQRVVNNGVVSFRFPEERRACYNKQSKPKHYIFGNLVVTASNAILEQRDVFAPPSLACEIPFSYALDVDCQDDLELAEWYIQTGKVKLPHIAGC